MTAPARCLLGRLLSAALATAAILAIFPSLHAEAMPTRYASAQPELSDATVTIDTSQGPLELGDAVHLSVHLAGGATNHSVSVFAKPAGGIERLLITQDVDANGDLALDHHPKVNTSYRVAYAGDDEWNGDEDQASINVRARIEAGLHRWASKSGRTFLYRRGATPLVRVALAPDHALDPVTFTLQANASGSWMLIDEATYQLNDQSRGAAEILNAAVGLTYRVRVTFEGDARNLSDRTPWMYFRKVANARTAMTARAVLSRA